MNNRRWTNLELLTLSDLYRDGLSYNEIACKLNRSEPAVATAIMKYRDVINIEYQQRAGVEPRLRPKHLRRKQSQPTLRWWT